MDKFQEPLTSSEWAEHYNIKQINSVVSIIKSGDVQPWAKELLNIIPEGSRCLEIGCGSGISSLWLAKNNRSVVALDYTSESIALVKNSATKLDIKIDVCCHDATTALPFEYGEFDYIYQCGLLEHFDTKKQIELLSNWGKYGRNMISMIPNSVSLPYMIGKNMMENSGTWEYGLEIPKNSMAQEFCAAGFSEIKEYSIGSEWSTKFLPENHILKRAFLELLSDGYDLDKLGQGYLLVTTGRGLL